MARNKIDYGIDLGTTNSAICRMEQGKPIIIKTDTQKDTMPSCVTFTRKGSVKVGDTAYNTLNSDRRKATKTWEEENNTFIEFKRTMGTNKTYHSSYMNKDYSSEELSAEVLKTLKSFVLDEQVKSVVITVPAKFTINQKDATMRAAKLAGFNHCELLQEPLAAAMAYGLKADNKDAYWLVFDFGGGTFDAALLNVKDGIIQVADTEGDNFLGGKDLDYAVVDNILIPYLQENFVIDDILADDKKRIILRDAMKTYAEPAKNQLSFKEKEDITSDLGDLGEDDEGTDLELDLTITQEDLKNVFTPIFQKAINICKDLLKRNNMTGSQLSSLILVGGPTHSPILRQMLKEQITQNVDTSVDPMTVVAVGAALYASTIDNEVKAEDLEKGTLFFDIAYDATTVDTETWATIKLNKAKCTGSIPAQVYAEIVSSDKSWSSGKVNITEKGDVIECKLKEGVVNTFIIEAYNEKGDRMECFPKEISINQGLVVGNATLPYNISIGVWDDDRQVMVTSSIQGLERNKQLPATGKENRCKTSIQLRPGNINDRLIIPIYQTDDRKDGVKAMYFDPVYEFKITGDDVDKLIPENSEVNITIHADRSEMMSIEIYVPSVDYEIRKEFDKSAKPTATEQDVRGFIKETQSLIRVLAKRGIQMSKYQQQLDSIVQNFDNGKDTNQAITHLRDLCKELDKYESGSAWVDTEGELNKTIANLQKVNGELGNSQTTMQINGLIEQANQAKQSKDVRVAKQIIEDMQQLYFQLTMKFQLMYMIHDLDNRFSSVAWKDRALARQLLDKGLSLLQSNPSEEELMPVCRELIQLMPKTQRDKYGSGGALHL